MTKQEYLQQVRKQIHYIFDRNKIEEELNQHLEDSTYDLMESGLSQEAAEDLAIKQMGDPVTLGKMLNKEHHPLIGYLCMASSTILILLLILSFFRISAIVFHVTDMTLDSLKMHDNKIATLNIDFDMSTHNVRLKEIGRYDYGDYYITYRTTTNYNYSRAGWSSSLFSIEDSNGNDLTGWRTGSHTFGMSYGTQQFTSWPDDGILHLIGRDGTTLTLNLKEYCNEKN